VDGNATGNRQTITATVTGLNWQPGQDLWIRWADLNDAGNDHGLAIDDLNFSAVPEPGALALAMFAAIGLYSGRRRA
jgi:hypothetical protein